MIGDWLIIYQLFSTNCLVHEIFFFLISLYSSSLNDQFLRN